MYLLPLLFTLLFSLVTFGVERVWIVPTPLGGAGMAVKDGDGGPKRKDAHAVRRTTYKGHELAFPADETTRTVYVDGVAHRYELLPRGYILDAWAYEPADSVEEVVKRYVDYKVKAAKLADGK